MAFPVVQTTAESAVTTAGTSHAVTKPSGTVSGDLWLIIFSHAVACTLNALTGWTELVDSNVNNGEKVLYRQCDGTEGASVTFTSSANTKSSHISFRITGHENPSTQAPQISTIATGADTTNPDAPSLTPTGGAKDYLWITFFTFAGEDTDGDAWAGTVPASYGNGLYKTTGTGGAVSSNCSTGTARRENNTATENPGAWGAAGAPKSWRAGVVAIHPTSMVTITGVVLTTTPSLPVGKLDHRLAGIALEATPSLPTGSITAGVNITGVELTVTPSLPTGSLVHTLTGVVLEATPSLPTGTLNHGLTGVVVTATPSLPIGSLAHTITGVALTATPSLPTGLLDHRLTGTVLTIVPEVPTGSIVGPITVTAITLTVTPELPIGLIQLLTGVHKLSRFRRGSAHQIGYWDINE